MLICIENRKLLVNLVKLPIFVVKIQELLPMEKYKNKIKVPLKAQVNMIW